MKVNTKKLIFNWVTEMLIYLAGLLVGVYSNDIAVATVSFALTLLVANFGPLLFSKTTT